jgi:lipoprotein-anchoring transpeptidase ErfK/SrfK
LPLSLTTGLPSRFRHFSTALLTVVALGTCWAIARGAAAADQRHAVRPLQVQPLLALDRNVVARTGPSPRAAAVGSVAARAPLTGSPMVLPVVQTATGPGGGHWVRVRLPMRPNGATGWIPTYSGSATATAWRILIRRDERRAAVFEGTTLRATYPIVVGTRTTPTPLGTYFVVEKLRLGPTVAEGPWALATSAYSNVLQEFGGGPGQIGLHGVVGLSAPLGTFASHGCVRFANAAITWIAAHVPDGSPIVIRR